MTTFNHGYALLIGISETPLAPKFALPVTAKDVEALDNVLQNPDICSYPTGQVGVLTGQGAALDNIKAGFIWLAKQVEQDENATAIIYFSGHGIKTTGDTRYGLIPADVESDQYGQINPDGPLLWSDEFQKCISSVKAKRLLVLIDSCHAEGASSKGEDDQAIPKYVKSAPPQSLINSLGKGEGRVVISSCRENQSSYYFQDKTMSIFTHHLVEALNGASNLSGDTEVRVSNLIHHLGKMVPATAQSQDSSYEQTPWTEQTAEDFSIALIGGGKGVTTKMVTDTTDMIPSARDEYNVPEIKNLLKAALISDQFDDLCQDHFSTIYDNISEMSDASRKRRKLIEYCEKNPSQFQVLLAQIKVLNSEQYVLYEERIFKS